MDGEPPEVSGDEEEDVDNRQHCHLTICIELDELTNSIRQTVSDNKIQLFNLILRRGALSTSM